MARENLANATVLAVDDQPGDLMAVQAILEPLGITVVVAQSGVEALRYMLSTDVALVILDIDMPTMDGLETARRIRERMLHRHTPIIFITGKGFDDPAFLEAYCVGAVDFLPKPVNPTVLRSKVAVFVDLFRQRYCLRVQAEQLRKHEQESLRRDLERRHLSEMREVADRQRHFLVDVLLSVTEGRLRLCDRRKDLPPNGGPYLSKPIALRQAAALRQLRDGVREAAAACNLPEDRCLDFVTAVSEAGMNAIVHARGGTARLCTGPDGSLQAWISDRGPGIALETLPRATLERGYSTAGTLGHGFWLMLNTADKLHLLTNSSGTTLVLEQGPKPLAPVWCEAAVAC